MLLHAAAQAGVAATGRPESPPRSSAAHFAVETSPAGRPTDYQGEAAVYMKLASRREGVRQARGRERGEQQRGS
jgi:hypothetical protein